jgi:hypothetical protein
MSAPLDEAPAFAVDLAEQHAEGQTSIRPATSDQSSND